MNQLFRISVCHKFCACILAMSGNVCRCDDSRLEDARDRFGTVSAVNPAETETPIVTLGQNLFWDSRLSGNGEIACASCHAASSWGADSERFSLDAKNNRTKRNSQTIFNAMLQPNLRWTGDRTSGAHQAEKSLTGSMGFSKADDVIPLLKQYAYERLFHAAFPSDASPLSAANYAKAIEAYESTLVTPAQFDQYLAGNESALTDKENSGLRLFIEVGCADCHSGRLLGGTCMERFGVYHDYWSETKSETRDAGLFEGTERESDRYKFRISMLRNIEKTAPYFHDGSVAMLDEAVRVMAKLQLDKELSTTERESIVAFLKTLTGSIPENYTRPSSLSR